MKKLTISILFFVTLYGCGGKAKEITNTPTSSPYTVKVKYIRPKLPQGPRDAEIKQGLKNLGIGLYTTYKSMNPKQFQIAKEIGAGHMLPRYAGNRRNMKPQQLLEYTNRAQQNGLKVVPWIYAYNSTQVKWLNEIEKTIGNHPAFAGVMIDIEHATNHKSLAKLNNCLAGMKKRHPNILIGYTGYNMGKTHQYVGIRQLVTMVDYWAPQVYWAHNGSSPEEFLYRGYDQWYSLSKEIGYDIVIAPVGQAYWVDGKRHMDLPKGTSEFTDFAKATAGYVSISWYHGDDLLSRPWAVTAIAVADKAR